MGRSGGSSGSFKKRREEEESSDEEPQYRRESSRRKAKEQSKVRFLEGAGFYFFNQTLYFKFRLKNYTIGVRELICFCCILIIPLL